jgi:hypothetical protein
MANHTPPCPYDANLTQDAFFTIYDRAQETVKKVSKDALVVAPSLSDGGPGNFGFTKTILPWLQAFLRHTHAQNTLPDVLSWHVSSKLHIQSAFLFRVPPTLRLVLTGAAVQQWSAPTPLN